MAPIGRLDSEKISKYFCNTCDKDYENSPKIEFENPNEEVAENLILVERGQYICDTCNTTIAEYREFRKPNEAEDVGHAKPIAPQAAQPEPAAAPQAAQPEPAAAPQRHNQNPQQHHRRHNQNPQQHHRRHNQNPQQHHRRHNQNPQQHHRRHNQNPQQHHRRHNPVHRI